MAGASLPTVTIFPLDARENMNPVQTRLWTCDTARPRESAKGLFPSLADRAASCSSSSCLESTLTPLPAHSGSEISNWFPLQSTLCAPTWPWFPLIPHVYPANLFEVKSWIFYLYCIPSKWASDTQELLRQSWVDKFIYFKYTLPLITGDWT